MSSVQGNNGKRKLKFNAFDVILVVIIIACIVIGAVMASQNVLPSITDSGIEVKLSYIITVNNIPEEIAAQITKDQTIYEFSSGQALGTISSINKTQYVIKGIDQSTGEQVLNEVPGRVNVNITVYATAIHEELGYYVNGHVITCGSEYSFRTDKVALNGVCVSMNDQ